VPVGKRIQTVIDCTPFPVAPLFDLFGAEQVVSALMHVGGKIVDVRGSGAFKIVIEVESVGTADAAQEGDMQSAGMEMGWMATAAVVAVIIVALPVLMRLATLFANYTGGGSSTGGGIMDYLKTLFGDYTIPVLIGGAVILFLLLKPGKGGSAPIIYNITGKKRESESED
jgi:hypothetical protein